MIELFLGRGKPSAMLHMVRPSLPVLVTLMATNDDEVLHPLRASSLAEGAGTATERHAHRQLTRESKGERWLGTP